MVDIRCPPMIFAQWDDLSERCRNDLTHSRPGSIIRCTEDDMGLLRGVSFEQLAKDIGGLPPPSDVQVT